MASNINITLVLNHLLNGDLEESLCRICLQTLPEIRENIFTRICKDDREYCLADVLEELCGIKFGEKDNYYVCLECYLNASNAYNFYLKTKRNNETLAFYVNKLEMNLHSIRIPKEVLSDSLGIMLPEFTPISPMFDYNLDGVLKQKLHKVNAMNEHKEDDEEIVIIKSENGIQTFYKPLADGSLVQINMEKDEVKKVNVVVEEKTRKKREPMPFKQCTRCPVKYRFMAKLKEHMQTVHGIILHICKICQALFEDEEEFSQHLNTHTNVHQCEICDTVFHKRETMITHLQWHKQRSKGSHPCKICGEILFNEEELQDHCNMKHYKKYTCYYCGRMYRGRISYDKHIEKHEKYIKMKKAKQVNPEKQVTEQTHTNNEERKHSKRFTCETCGRSFLAERALVWHNRLHTNERPYTCHTCGRGFVSESRVKQHALCAHTAPARRCPLCPALFHLRSMINTHIKKVHLREHKRRNRTIRQEKVLWKTETVPIQELSVAIQNEILEIQAARAEANTQNV